MPTRIPSFPTAAPREPQPLMRALCSALACGVSVALMSVSSLPLAAKASTLARVGGHQRTALFSPLSAPGTETVLERFAGSSTGARPVAPLSELNGVLYGTTLSGGSYNKGTVFSITPAGKAHLVYSFKTGTDGSQPTSQLTVINGALYGVTFTGGAHGDGTVFEVTTSGAERIVYSFKGGTDGANPESNLIDVNGTLYGTTTGGGSNSGGVIFAVNPATDAEHVLHTFGKPVSQVDGSSPIGQLADVNGTVYGSTLSGGLANCGMIFAFTPSGAETNVYEFRGGIDGCSPTGGLTNVNGTLYGTNAGAGAGYGTIFKATTGGLETVIYYFHGGTDGATPLANLISFQGVLYGTTFNGGAHGKGTVFSLAVTSTSSTEQVLHAFSGTPDGANPEAGLLDVNGLLYGTTNLGGQSSPLGTVYSIVP